MRESTNFTTTYARPAVARQYGNGTAMPFNVRAHGYYQGKHGLEALALPAAQSGRSVKYAAMQAARQAHVLQINVTNGAPAHGRSRQSCTRSPKMARYSPRGP